MLLTLVQGLTVGSTISGVAAFGLKPRIEERLGSPEVAEVEELPVG